MRGQNILHVQQFSARVSQISHALIIEFYVGSVYSNAQFCSELIQLGEVVLCTTGPT